MDDGAVIPDTFKGKVVFITGATGFVGKVLLEKLLRSCPDISEVILLLRPTKKSCDERFSEYKKNRVFDVISLKYPAMLDKIRYVSGDIVSKQLGLEEANLKKLINEVSFVFHCAASVRFEDEPEKTFSINLLGVKHLLDVCHSMKKLEAFVHVSTAYSFCNQPVISEQIYPESIGPQHILDCLNWMDKEQLRTVSDFVVQSRPSLYHYSKAMAEIYLAEHHGNLPVIIVRPSVITASVKEPFPGWIDNHNGPTGFIALSSKGIIRTLLVKEGVNADWIPVDVVANTLIAAAHLIAKERATGVNILMHAKPSGIPIINCVCPNTNVITWSEIIRICIPLVSKYPSLNFYRLPGKGTVTSSPALHTICKYVFHYLPSVILDVLAFPYYRRMKLVTSFRRIHGVMNHLHHYTTHSFSFTSLNMQKLPLEMSNEDCNVFPVDLDSLVWVEYLDDYVHGVRKFFLGEVDRSLPSAREKVLKLQRFHHVWNITAAGIVLVYLYKTFPQVNTGMRWSFMLISKSLQMIGKL